MRRARARPWLVALAVASACAELPEVQSGACGNGVIDSGEDCDTYRLPGASASCRPQGATHACHLDCRPGEAGTRPSCPAGWGCDVEGVCRAPTGEFEAPVDVELGGIVSLLSGDFDGDLRADVLSRGPTDLLGRAPARFHYFDEHGLLDETRRFPKLVTAPVIADLGGDGRSDVVFSDFQIGVLLGRGDRDAVPETYSSYLIPEAGLRIYGISEGTVGFASPLTLVTTLDGTHGLYIPDEATGRLQLRLALPGPVEELVGDPALGNVVESSSCLEMALAWTGAKSVSLVEFCTQSPPGEAAWRPIFESASVELDPPKTIDRAPLIADIDGDGHQDMLLRAEGGLYVSYGDGVRLSTAVPYGIELSRPQEMPDDLMPLAAADLTGDGIVDFVFDVHVMVGFRAAGAVRYLSVSENSGEPWTTATVADLDGNGFPDAAMGSATASNIALVRGNGTAFPVTASLATLGPVQYLSAGDFDGDSIDDLAYIETALHEDRDPLMVAFGAAGRLEPARPVARVRQAEQLSTYHEHGLDHLVVSSHEQSDGQERSSLTMLSGNPDRIPFAPYTLVTFASDGRLEGAGALVLALGHFTAEGHADLMALGAPGPQGPFHFWVLPEIGQGDHTPLRLMPAVEEPFSAGVPRSANRYEINARGASGDFDGDGRDEALWTLRADDGEHCGLVWIDVSEDDPPKAVHRTSLVLEQACPDAQVLPVDADGDGALDVALLDGRSGGSDRQLWLLWNDGHGGFSASEATRVGGAGESPQAFAALAATTVHPSGFAYVTRDAVMRQHASGSRRLSAAQKIATLEQGTGIVAADFNGDGITDLAVADAGNLRLLRGKLKEP